jgi:L-histidine N-alpha-methyltransferase
VTSEFADDVARGLSSRPKSVPPKHFYDELGSRLFDAICRLPWYTITRAELALLPRAASRVLDSGGARTLVELGPGSGEKLAALLAHAPAPLDGTTIHLVDISAAALDESERKLGAFPGLTLVSHRASFEEGLAAAARGRKRGERRLVLFLGSNVGNLDAEASARFLCMVRHSLEPGDGLLLGADLVKDEAALLLAYDDPLGVTAAFDKNLLVRMNRELGADFDLDAFDHRALWNAAESRVEMHLVARRACRVTVPGSGVVAEFAAGESLFTESSYKYELDSLTARVTSCGFTAEQAWRDDDARYALLLFFVA